MLRTIIKLDRENGGQVLFGVLNRIEYVLMEGLYIELNDLIRPYLLNLFKSRGYIRFSI